MPTTGLEPVRRFRHWSLKPACLPIPARGQHQPCRPNQPPMPCSRRDSNPHGVNPHRVLNPARLPIPPPEPETNSGPIDPATHGAEGNRTPDLLNAIQALSQLSYGPSTHTDPPPRGRRTSPRSFQSTTGAGLTRLELATSGVTDRHSNRLSYSPLFSNSPSVLPYAPTGNRTPVSTLKESCPNR